MSNPADLQEKLKLGIEAARRGDREAARLLLRQVVSADPRSESAWMWLASVVDSLAERRACLQNALKLNPNNQRAREALNRLDAAAAGRPAPPARRAPPQPAAREQAGGLRLVIAGAEKLKPRLADRTDQRLVELQHGGRVDQPIAIRHRVD